MKRWLTGKEVMDTHDLRPWEMAALLEGGLAAYEPTTGNRYISPINCKKIGEIITNTELMVQYAPTLMEVDENERQRILLQIADELVIPTGHVILQFHVLPGSAEYRSWLDIIKYALFRPWDVKEAVAVYHGQPSHLECIADLEGQLAEARQENDALRAENDALRAEVVNLRAEAAEADGAEADPFNLTPVQIRDLKAFIMKAEGKTTDDIGDELHPDTPGTSLKDVVGRSIRKGKNLIRWSDKPTA